MQRPGMRSLWTLPGCALLVAIAACSSPRSDAPPPAPPGRLDAAPPKPTVWSRWSDHTAIDLASLPGVTGSPPEIGTADPLDHAEADPHGRWVLVCQSRDDALSWYFVLGAGKGIRLEEVLAVSDNGDFMVVRLDGVTALVDVVGAKASRLSNAASLAGFSKDSKRVVYVEPGPPARLVRRDLASGIATRVAIPAGVAGAIDVDTSGAWAMVAMARHDENGNGTLEFNYYGWRKEHQCSASRPSLFADPIDILWIDLETGEVRDDPRILRVAGGHVIEQHEAKLFLDRKPIGPTDCSWDRVLGGLVVLGVVEAPPRLLIWCAGSTGKTISLVDDKRVLAKLPGHWMFPTHTRVAPMLAGPEACLGLGENNDLFLDSCIDLASGKRSTKRRLPLAMGVHDGRWWLAHDDQGRTLVGPPEATHGPLRWHLR